MKTIIVTQTYIREVEVKLTGREYKLLCGKDCRERETVKEQVLNFAGVAYDDIRSLQWESTVATGPRDKELFDEYR